jgi:hypothetical protein
MTRNAMKLAENLEASGTPPDVAEELAKEQLLQKPPDEQDRPAPWEVEGAQADILDAVQKYLLNLPDPSSRSPSPPAPKTPET